MKRGQPLQRRTPLRSRTPIRPKRLTSRRLPAKVCARLRCRRRQAVLDLCKTHAAKEAYALFSLLIRARDKRCQKCGTTRALQCAHLLSRRHRPTAWDEANAVALCASCHKRFTESPAAWNEWMKARLGGARFWRLHARALRGPSPDLAVILAALRKRTGGTR